MGGRTLRLWTEGYGSNELLVLDTYNGHGLYRTHKSFGRKVIKLDSCTGGKNITIGKAAFHASTSRIDLSLHGHRFTLSSGGCFISSRDNDPKALTDKKLTWERESWPMDGLICTDSDEKIVARLEPDVVGGTMKGTGKLFLLAEHKQEGYPMEQVLLTALALLYKIQNLDSGWRGGGRQAGDALDYGDVGKGSAYGRSKRHDGSSYYVAGDGGVGHHGGHHYSGHTYWGHHSGGHHHGGHDGGWGGGDGGGGWGGCDGGGGGGGDGGGGGGGC